MILWGTTCLGHQAQKSKQSLHLQEGTYHLLSKGLPELPEDGSPVDLAAEHHIRGKQGVSSILGHLWGTPIKSKWPAATWLGQSSLAMPTGNDQWRNRFMLGNSWEQWTERMWRRLKWGAAESYLPGRRVLCLYLCESGVDRRSRYAALPGLLTWGR